MSNLAQSIDYQDVSIINAWLTTRGNDWIKGLFTTGNTLSIVSKFDNVNDLLELPTSDVNRAILQGYNGVFEGGKVLDIGKLQIRTADFKAELSFERLDRAVKAYVAYIKGQNIKAEDLEIVEYLLMEIRPKMAQELGDAVWNGKKDAAAAQNAPIMQKLDGYLSIAKTLHGEGKATMVTVDAEMDDSNCYEATMEVVRDGVDRLTRRSGLTFFCSDKYFEHFREGYLNKNIRKSDVMMEKYENLDLKGVRLSTIGQNSWLVPMQEIMNDNALIGTRPNWLAFAYNLAQPDMNQWRTIPKHYTTEASATFPVGTQILMQRQHALIINSNL